MLLINQYQSLLKESEKHLADQRALWDRYWTLADVAGQRSQWELQAALRALERTTQDNLGASYVAAITLTRLGRWDDAEAMIKRMQDADPLGPLVLVARAEWLARSGKRDEANQALEDALRSGKVDVRVRLHRAVVWLLLDSSREATNELSAVLKAGGA